jgi:hypothetical protein
MELPTLFVAGDMHNPLRNIVLAEYAVLHLTNVGCSSTDYTAMYS